MKAWFVILFWYLATSATWAQADLQTALGKGDVNALSSHFSNTVEVSILGREATLSKTEAATRLQGFYTDHPARGFRTVHRGTSKDSDSNYMIGELSTDKGTYRVYIYFQQQGERRLVSELRIES
jgi:hypothetical protein